MTPRTIIQDEYANLPTATERHRARRNSLGTCMAGFKGCVRVRMEGKTCCAPCIARQKMYYQVRKARKAASNA